MICCVYLYRKVLHELRMFPGIIHVFASGSGSIVVHLFLEVIMVLVRIPGLLVARLSSIRSVGSTGSLYRLSSSSSKSGFNNSPIQATVSDDGKTIVCWHPEQLSHVKYEHTKPLPVQKEVDSVIKAEVHSEVDRIIYTRDLNDEDLIRLAYRPRSLWKIPTRERKRHLYNPDPPLDRIGI